MYIDKIKFERTGGFAGIRLAAEVDMDDIPEDQKREIIRLIDETDFDELPKKLSGKMPMPDEFVYSITVNSRGKEHAVLAGESSLPNNLQPLIEVLERIAKIQMRKQD
ncbi:MAG TPA: hypothetical protein DCX53_14040 [Anaerolineae bacterium]|nr:hypothetical protein [Anaerolineae bacterium]